MKLIHTADLHLDSKLKRHLDDRRAKERRDELLISFQRLVSYAVKEGVEAILIAGDLFDVTQISATARNAVYAAMKEHPEILFFYLRGNHDADAFLQDVKERFGALPENLRLFSDKWTSYTLRGTDGVTVQITGAEMSAENKGELAASLLLDQKSKNIVMLHGQEVETAGKMDAEVIPLREYKNKGIDYMALGHIHAPKLEKLDARGVYAYAGCLEGRGFDECGPRGFYLLDATEEGMKASFVPFAKRLMHELTVDASSTLTSDEAVALTRKAAAQAGVAEKDMVKVILSGETSMDAQLDEGYIAKSLEEDFYFVKVVDKTVPKVDYDSFALDVSLKGEYVRSIKAAVQTGELEPEQAADMIRLGIRLLAGEEKLV
ncbi:MAG: DNA repair exonuclease [Lachnospiraceae bacterium]|nr:DNA repair exonuclease [Lachnospiraceae bacterium]